MSNDRSDLPDWVKIMDAHTWLKDQGLEDGSNMTTNAQLPTDFPNWTDGTAYMHIHPADLDKIRAIVAEELHKIVMRFAE